MIKTKKSILMIISGFLALFLSFLYLLMIGVCYLIIKKLPPNPMNVGIFVIIIICFPVMLSSSTFYFLCAKTYFTFASGKKNNDIIISRTNGYSIVNLLFILPSSFVYFVDRSRGIIMLIIFLTVILFMFLIPQIEIRKRKEEIKKQLFNIK